MAITTFATIGDSLTAGLAYSHAVADGGSGSWVEDVAESLGRIAGIGPLLSSGYRGVSIGVIGSDLEWVYTTGADAWTNVATTDAFDVLPYGKGRYANGSTKIATATRPPGYRPCVGFCIYIVDLAGGGDGQYRIDGGTWTNFGQALAGDNRILKWYVPLPVNSTVEFRAFDGTTARTIMPAGIEWFYVNPTTPGLTGFILHNFAVGTTALFSEVQVTSGDRMAIFDNVKLGTGSPPPTTPNAGVLMMHINDVSLINNTTTWAANVTTFVNRVAPLGPVGLLSPWECGGASTSQANYRAQTKLTGSALGAKVLDLYDLLNNLGYTTATATVAAGMTGVQTGTFVGQQTVQVLSTAGFAPVGEFALTGTAGNDAKITYTSIDATHFYGCTLVTGADVALTFGDTLTISQAAGLSTDGYLEDGTHETQLLHDLLGDRVFWWVVTNFFKVGWVNGFGVGTSGLGVTGLGPDAVANPLTDVALGSDSVARTAAHPRSQTDTALGSDALTRALVQSRAVADASLGTDSVVAPVGRPRFLTDQALGSDSVARTAAAARALTDSALGADAVSRTGASSRSSTDQALGSDALSRTFIAPRQLADQVLGSDALAEDVAASRALVDTSLGSDALTRSSAKSRTLDDQALGADVLARTKLATRSLTDTALGADSTTSGATQPRTGTETALGGDVLGRLVVFARTLTDQSLGGDATSRATAAFRSSTDAVLGGDVVTASGANTPQMIDASLGSDSVARLANLLRSSVDLALGADSTGSGISTHVADTSLGSDAVSRTLTSRPRAVTDAALGVDALLRSFRSTRTLNDDGLGSDSVSITGTGILAPASAFSARRTMTAWRARATRTAWTARSTVTA